MSPAVNNKKTSPKVSRAQLAGQREVTEAELATLHGEALKINVNEFLECRDEFIGLLYRAADYSVWRLRDTYTQYLWAALTLGLEPNQDDPPLGPIPIQPRVAELLAQRDPPSQHHNPYSQRLCSFDFIVELIESSHKAGRLPYMEQGPMRINFLKEDLIFWSESKGLPVAAELLDTGGGTDDG